MKCPAGEAREQYNQVQITLGFPPRDQGGSKLLRNPRATLVLTVLSVLQGEAAPGTPPPTSRGAWCCIEDPGTRREALGRHRRGRDAYSPLPRNVQDGRATVPRARPHNHRKPFTFSKNNGTQSKEATTFTAVPTKPGGDGGGSVRNLIHLIWLHFM